MTDNLRNLKKELKAFAKRVKDFKYTDSALITFLLTGMLGITGFAVNLYSAEDEIKTQEHAINTSILQLQKDFKRARQENNKLLRTTNLELIQLMEQGDHVVKSPWSSWQYGMNYVNNNWNGEYKGRGDKVKDVRYTRDTSSNRFKQGSMSLSYGETTQLGNVIEPNAEIPVSASLTPLIPKTKTANLAMNVNLSGLPSFEPTVVDPPVAPSKPNMPTIPQIHFTLNASSSGNGSGIAAFDRARSNGAIEGVISGGGTFNVKRGMNGASGTTMWYKYSDYKGTAPSSWGTLVGDITSNPWSGETGTGITGSYLGFQKVVSGFGLSNTNSLVTYVGDGTNVREFVHMDHHNHFSVATIRNALNSAATSGANWDGSVSSGSSQNVILTAFDEVASLAETSTQGGEATSGSDIFGWMNSGRLVMEGIGNTVTNNYDHNGQASSKSVHINVGDILFQPYFDGTNYYDTASAVFSTSNGGGADGHFVVIYNGATGNIDAWTKKSAYFLSDDASRDVTLINRGNINLYGEGSVGIFSQSNPQDFNLQFVSSDFSFNTATNTLTGGSFKPITIYGDGSAGYYSNKAGTTTEGNFAVNIGAAGVGNKGFSTNATSAVTGNAETNGTPLTNYDVNSTDTKANAKNNPDYIRGSIGIYSETATNLTSHDINIFDKTEGNVGVLPGANVLLNIGGGNITINGGSTAKDNVGIYIDNSKGGAVKSTGDINVNDGLGNLAVVASGSTRPSANTVEVRKINGNNTKNSTIIYADLGATVKADELNIVNSTIEADASTVNKKNAGAVYAKNSGTVVTIDRAAVPSGDNIVITGTKQTDSNNYTGFGLFADDSAVINARNNKIKVTNGGSGIVSNNSANIIADGGALTYIGNGYALYSDGTGQISLQNGTLTLGGSSIGYVLDVAAGTNPINLNGTTIDVQSNNVILMDLRNAGILNTLGLAPQLMSYLAGTTISGGSNAYTYKYAVVDGSTLNINSDINKNNMSTTSDDYIFTRRLLLQNSIINVNGGKTVTANLNTTDLAGIDSNLTVPVGLAVAASSHSVNNATTGILNDGTVNVNRTDSGNGGVGLYVNYGHINNNGSGVVNVETTGNNPNAVGIYATNNTPVVNNGTVTVGGNKSFGILGLSYRLDNSGAMVDPSLEAYYEASNSVLGEYGKVNITNNGTITVTNDSAIGIYAHNNSLSAANATDQRAASDIKAVNNGTVNTNGGNNSIGMGTNRGTLTNASAGIINVNGTVSAGMYGTNSSVLTNNGTINVGATASGIESIGIYTDDINTPITTSGTINVGTSSYGVFGKNINMIGGTINIGDNGVGVYSTGPNVNVNGTINAGNNNAVGVYVEDASPATLTTVNGNANMTIGDNQSFGYIVTSTGAPVNLTTGVGTVATVGEKSVYIYSAQPYTLGTPITNNTVITATKNNGYGIYSAQNVNNYGSMDLRSAGGVGNIGIYTINGATGHNYSTIEVGKTNLSNEEYGIGMATGYYNKTTGAISNQGRIENHGTINVKEDGSIGMYAVGRGSTAVNRGTINLDGNNTTGMYIDRYAVGENYGIIQTIPNATGTGIKGIVAVNGGVIKNYGTIEIKGTDNMGIYRDIRSTYDELASAPLGNTSDVPLYIGTPTTEKTTGSVTIQVPNKVPVPTVTLNGIPVPITKVDTNVPTASATDIYITDDTGTTTLNLASAGMQNTQNVAKVLSIGMYVDTSGINYTNPIQGLQYLKGLKEVNLIMGNEATHYTGAKAIEIGDNILNPYNQALKSVVTTGGKVNVNSGSLTWMAQPTQSTSGTNIIDKVYLVKVPYTDFASAKDPDTKNFLDGLEQRYGVEGVTSREKQLFNKLNDLGKGEGQIFAQAVNEMKGYQYSNTQQRINETGSLLDKEFSYLQDQWRNPSKDSNKIKVFGMRNEYNTDTAGVIDNESNAYGVAYVHEKEDVRMGHSQGWYAGAVNNHYKFKDLGGSRENQTMVKAGVFKTMSPAKDHNGALQWTIAGDVFAGRNEMKRRFWIVDDTFNAKSDYYSYGAALKTDLGYDIRTSERTHLRPYGALKVEYGRFTDIKEDDGEIRLTVDGNDYISVKPEVGVEFKYVQPMALKTNLSVGLTAAYTDELGKVNELNKAKVRYTTADWYNLKNEKEDRKGSGKFDLNIGIDNTRFGVTVNAGYDTKGENVRGGLGFRLIY